MKSNFVILMASILLLLFVVLGCEKTVYKEDATAPQIEAEPTVTTTDSTATITWVTDEPANGLVRYGTSSGVYDSTLADLDEYSLNHSFTIKKLTPNTTYYFIVESKDFHGNGPVKSDEQTFTTKHNEYSYTQLGWLFFEEANYDSSLAYFENARSANPNYAELYTGLGWCHIKLDLYSDALEELGIAINIDESALDAYAGRSAVYLKMDSPQSAIEDAQVVLDMDSLYVFDHDTNVTYLDLHLILAECYYQTQKYDLASQEVEYLANIFGLSFNLDVNDYSTWTDPSNPEIVYSSYEEALLMWIQYLKDFV